MRMKSMDALREKMARHPRREIVGRSWNGTPCLELLTLDGKTPVKLNKKGYARVSDGRGGKDYVTAHRATLAVETGRNYWTEPLEADHLCHTRNCVRPEHLEWVSHAVNCSSARMSPEGAAARRSAARATAEARRIAAVSRNLDTGGLRWHRDQHSAAREFGLRVGSISMCLHGKCHRTGRYAFERYDEEDEAHVNLYLAKEW